MGEPLTERQSQVYRYIIKYVEEHGFQPSVRHLCTAFGIGSPNGIHIHLRALAKKGHITLNKDRKGFAFNKVRFQAVEKEQT
jgi:repressor LexA